MAKKEPNKIMIFSEKSSCELIFNGSKFQLFNKLDKELQEKYENAKWTGTCEVKFFKVRDNMLLSEDSKGKKKEELREDTAFLEIDLDKLQQLPNNVKLELMFYGLTVLLQRETASLKASKENVELAVEKIKSRWKQLQKGEWKSSKTEKTSPVKLQQLKMLNAVSDSSIRLTMLKALYESKQLKLELSEVKELLTEKDYSEFEKFVNQSN